MRREERLEQIFDAGARVLGERGFYGTTLRDVARTCNVSVANLYRYVSGKEELLYQVQRRILNAAIASAEAAMAARGARDRLRAVVTDHIRRIIARPAEAAVLQPGPNPLPDPLGRRIEEMRRKYINLDRAASEAVVRTGARTRRDAERRTHMLLGMADRVALQAAWQTPKARPDRLAAPVLAVFLDGAAGRARKKKTAAKKR